MSRNLGLHPRPRQRDSGLPNFFGMLFVIGVVIVALGYFFGA